MARLTAQLKFRATLGSIAIVLVGICSLQAAGLQKLVPSHHTSYRAVLDQYCVTCHNEKARTAELLLDTANVENVGEGPELWEKVVKKLRTGAMPPAGLPRPDQAIYDSFATYLETELDRAAAANPNPGRPVMHRLNRVEYTNAVRDLLAVDIDGETLLPADDSRYGFDNIGDVLTVSPVLLERYLSAARKISRLAVGDPDTAPTFGTYTVPKYFVQDDRMNEALPFGSRGGIAVRHPFPLDGEYVVKVRLVRNSRDYIQGLLDEPHQLDVRLDGARLKLFTIGGEKHGRSAPLFSNNAMGDREQDIYERNADDILEVRFWAAAGPQQIEVAFLKETSMPEGPLRTPMSKYDRHNYKGGDPGVASVSISGPYNAKGLGETPSRRKIFECRPSSAQEEKPCARKILSTLAHRAYRRPLTEEDVQTLLDFYTAGRDEGGFEAGIGRALERILVGPEFLFRIEVDPENVAPDTAYRISDLELASRLSFFLWSSIPDDQLLDLAEGGKLQDPVVLEQQVRRLLKDSRSKALVNNFAAQWLQLRSLRAINPDQDVFPYFEENLREAFRLETELFFESQLREDRSVLELLSANYTFLNERLARHYGIPNVYGSHFRRVELETEERRGLLGKGSILAVTSYANRTSPVLRGKWVLENILGTPPPPPPPNVPDLVVRATDGKALSMREAMEQHRANPVCATCHKLMDPLGFALENFDGIGTWRTMDAGDPIDPSGVLPDGTPFRGPAELQRVLLESKSAEFVATATERLLTYALGRGVESYDAPAIRNIIREAAPNNYRWSSLILAIVKSTPFQMRRSRELESVDAQ
ncbi:MAG: DUF1592 domain-containing protein [Acidobacteria bacterium]|nr:DUF1592 domain-containing protein [Acidobacteriota bacterium]